MKNLFAKKINSDIDEIAGVSKHCITYNDGISITWVKKTTDTPNLTYPNFLIEEEYRERSYKYYTMGFYIHIPAIGNQIPIDLTPEETAIVQTQLTQNFIKYQRKLRDDYLRGKQETPATPEEAFDKKQEALLGE